ncbi:MAG: DNA mismatch repair endonuclease MutH [Gammaproteobacteria bacterium]|nr:DNA mismatch repair endonuclease MutH [Gammaproteobacteria bacterium]MDH5629420.1 DNA mismatch repair endonuclease MutH [Gammaproteobacteria bacterium]
MLPSKPQTLSALLQRSGQLAGKTIADVARFLELPIPDNLKTQKGWQGQLLEQFLGADGGNLSQPDFSSLGVELKTLPIDQSGKVQESTFVCTLPLINNEMLLWQDSVVYQKLKAVLWVPIVQNPDLSKSIIATPFYWNPDNHQMQMLQRDWEAVMDLVSLGRVDQITARMGQILQIRPKAANAKATTNTIDSKGKQTKTLPRGFYLRAAFTQQLLLSHLKI